MNDYWKERVEAAGGVEELQRFLGRHVPESDMALTTTMRAVLELAQLALNTLTAPMRFVKHDTPDELLDVHPGPFMRPDDSRSEVVQCENCKPLIEAVDKHVLAHADQTTMGVSVKDRNMPQGYRTALPHEDATNYHRIPVCDWHALKQAAAKARR